MRTRIYASAIAIWLLLITGAALIASTLPQLDFGVGAGAAHPTIVIGIAVHGEFDGTGSTIYRAWSDGLIERNWTACAGCDWAGWEIVPEN